jgi:GH15 family glucan-1,4-alpha-glucosidase
MPLRIGDYALIGDCETAALVGRDGSIDWLCWPRFDSDACFAALLGKPENGRWLIAPDETIRSTSRRYRDETLILETDFETDAGAVRLIDFMPIRGEHSDVVRIVEGLRGSVRLTMELLTRFDYGRLSPWLTVLGSDSVRAIAGPHSAMLRSPVPLTCDGKGISANFTVERGQRLPFTLLYQASHLAPLAPDEPEALLKATERFWRDWVRQCRYRGPWREAVVRSLITLKAMTYSPTGGIVAAPTTSLPERKGGERNWDYRYCWLRDAAFAVSCLLKTGYRDEATAWRDWLLRAVAAMPAAQIQPLYGIAGEYRINEWTVSWLPGYCGAMPVRVGNAASAQFQLDAFGHLMDALHIARNSDLARSDAGWNLQKAIVEHIAEVWRTPDYGIWEIRDEPQHFVLSKVMAWAALDRAIRAVTDHGMGGAAEKWQGLRDEIHEDVCRRGYSPKRRSFVQSYGSDALDAGNLLIPIVGFLPGNDPRVRETIDTVERELTADGLVLRYDTRKTKDGLPPGEGVFLACSFWLAQDYSLTGRHAEARRLFERLLSLRNDVGLLAEEYDPTERCFLGNFPQALSHLALVNTADILEKQSSDTAPPLD